MPNTAMRKLETAATNLRLVKKFLYGAAMERRRYGGRAEVAANRRAALTEIAVIDFTGHSRVLQGRDLVTGPD